MIRKLARAIAHALIEELIDRGEIEKSSQGDVAPPLEPLPPWVTHPSSGTAWPDASPPAFPNEAQPLTPDQRAGLEDLRDRYAPDRLRQRIENRETVSLDELRRRKQHDAE